MSDDTICRALGGSLVTIDEKMGTEYCELPNNERNAVYIENTFCDQRADYVTFQADKQDLPRIADAMGLKYMSSFALCADTAPSKFETTGQPVLGLFRKDLTTESAVRKLSDNCQASGIGATTCENLKKVAEENPKVETDSFWSPKNLFKTAFEGLIIGAGFVFASKWFGGKGGDGGGGGSIDTAALAAAMAAALAEAAKNAPQTPPATHQIGVEVPLAVATAVAVEASPSILASIGEGLWLFGEGAANLAGAAASLFVVVPESTLMAPPNAYDNGPI